MKQPETTTPIHARVRRRNAGLDGFLGAAILTILLAAPSTVAACSVCFGDPNAKETKAMAAGILFMLGCIGTLLVSFAAVFCYWAVRSHRLHQLNDGATN